MWTLGTFLALFAANLLSATSLQWQEAPGCRFAEVRPPASGKPGFTLLTAAVTGITFANLLSEDRVLASQILTSGSGVAAGDVDGDGWCDLYFCGLDAGNRLYRNEGDWRFRDITRSAGVACDRLDSSGAVFADVDGDRDLDLLVNSYGGGTRLFFNDGQGRFQPSSTLLNAAKGGTSLALADIEGDGDLDLYVANYRTNSIADEPGTRFSVKMIEGQPVVTQVNGRPVTHPSVTNRFRFMFELGGGRGKFAYQENGEPDVLFLNDGRGRFAPVSFTRGRFLDEAGKPLAQPPHDWGLTAAFRDLNQDGNPDLYVANDFDSLDRIWLNDGRGRFRALPALSIRQTCYSAMSLDFADLNRDGFDEIFVVDMLSFDAERRLLQRNNMMRTQPPLGAIENRPQYSRNMLHLNRGDGTYAEIAQHAGIEASDWSWSPAFLDVDLDGYEDLLIPNGFERDNMNLDAVEAYEAGKRSRRPTSAQHYELRRSFPRLATENLAFRNLGNLRFVEMGRAWGFDTPTISQGLCLADLDNDGDLDVVVNNMNDAAGVYRNNAPAPRVAVRLAGVDRNTRGVGARISIQGGAVPVQSQEMMCGGRYLSGDDAMRVFAAGSLENRMRLEVRWRSGRTSRIEGVQANRIYTVMEAVSVATVDKPSAPSEGGEGAAASRPRPSGTIFREATAFRHVHRETLFDDFERQPLLPKRLSQLGPGVAWYDLDEDGWDDLIVGNGKGGRLAVYRNDGHDGWSPWNSAVLGKLLTRDAVGVLGVGAGGLLVGLASYEDGLAVGAAVREYRLREETVTDVVDAWPTSLGPLALGDVDADGDLDLFLGGRVVPGQYPEAGSSRLYRREGERWVADELSNRRLSGVGLVSGARWTDLDGDGWPELVLACEWGALKVFRNRRGELTEATRDWGLDRFTGWWQGVASGDFNGDGRLDLVASNWGTNTKYQSRREKALTIHYGDLDEDGTLDVIEAGYDPVRKKYLPERRLDTMTKAIPALAERFQSHAAYARAGLQDGFGDLLSQAGSLEANWLETTLFLNQGDRFEARVLPLPAQLAPALAVCVADYDGDGAEDIFLGQNFFAVEPETSRYDAGRGLWLKGDGQGGFQAVAGQESGIEIYGEQRSAAVCDYNADGRVDLAVTQNAAATKLFRNVGGTRGLRVGLRGPPGNPTGVGATLRLKFGDRYGPSREIHAGSGYWSQDSAVPVLGSGEHSPTHVWVRWPGGRTHTVTIPPGSLEIAIDENGTVTRLR